MAVQRSWFRKRLVLSSAIFVAVFFFLAALHSCNGSAKPAPSVSNNEVIDPAVAKTLYNVKCGICHGADGAMNYAGAKDLTISTLPRAEVIAHATSRSYFSDNIWQGNHATHENSIDNK